MQYMDGGHWDVEPQKCVFGEVYQKVMSSLKDGLCGLVGWVGGVRNNRVDTYIGAVFPGFGGVCGCVEQIIPCKKDVFKRSNDSVCHIFTHSRITSEYDYDIVILCLLTFTPRQNV